MLTTPMVTSTSPSKPTAAARRGQPAGVNTSMLTDDIAATVELPLSESLKSRQQSDPAGSMESTATLLALVRDGDSHARERLCALYLPILRNWARGRLPAHARDLAETDDMVQVTLLRALNRIDEFNPRHEGAFLAYLRRILLNNIRAEVRRVAALPRRCSPEDQVIPSDQLSVVDAIAGEQLMAQYEQALAQLSESQREAVMLRVEFGFSYPEIAGALNISTANAARMAVCRALEKLTELM